jgi:mono/diheme cytochrome c family protein
MVARPSGNQRASGRNVVWRHGFCLLTMLLACGGCVPERSPPGTAAPPSGASHAEFVSSDNLRGLSPELASLVSNHVRTEAGTPAAPRLVGDRSFPSDQLAAALALYRVHCSGCHGHTGEGTGLWAGLLRVMPRDFRRGIFKFQSTPYGAKPVREDLKYTITRGIPGSLMPPFGHLREDQREQLALAVELLARRGEFEDRLALEVELPGEGLTAEETAQIAAELAASWREATEQVIQPLSPQPDFTPDSVARGREKFIQKGCAKCHGEDGRGQTEQNLQAGLRDVWGHPVQAADLTTGRLKGGSTPLDIYRRIVGGINGTPMPSFRTILWSEPESIWDLVAWVLHLGQSNQPAAGVETND